ncbi:hypothetical protein [Dyella koreensis]|uniref:hypothetical protein n=1 Tax=Dyella koreensis TaxID=311235 RepID=UPI003608A88E
MTISFKLPPGWAGPLEGKGPWPLRFYSHSFGARHFHTQRCQIIYNNNSFTRLTGDKPAGPPPVPNWQDDWSAHYGVVPSDHGGRTFPGPVELWWTSLDGVTHEATLDLDALFKERLILHSLAKDEIPEGWLAGCSRDPISPDILVEVNDRTVSIYMRALVATKEEQIPGNPHSKGRNDLMLAWTHTY